MGEQNKLPKLVLRWLEIRERRWARGFYGGEGVGLGYEFLPPGTEGGCT